MRNPNYCVYIVLFVLIQVTRGNILVNLTLLRYTVKSSTDHLYYCNPTFTGDTREQTLVQLSGSGSNCHLHGHSGMETFPQNKTGERQYFTAENTIVKSFNHLENMTLFIVAAFTDRYVNTPMAPIHFCESVFYSGPNTNQSFEIANKQTSISVSGRISFFCPDFYYGWNCTTYCKRSDDSDGHYTCLEDGRKLCMLDYEGDNCTETIDDCVNVTCHHHGQCIDGVANYTCNCSDPYFGVECERKHDYCKESNATCSYHGDCRNDLHNYICNCSYPYVGVDCEKKRDFCKESNATCSYHGDCRNDLHNYTCNCSYPYVGVDCEKKRDFCQESNATCNYHGDCKNDLLNYNCTCYTGYRGPDCESYVCDNVHCYNNGTCEDDGLCHCPDGFTGSDCSRCLNACSNNPCENGGKCKADNCTTTCICSSGYTGKHCQIKEATTQKVKATTSTPAKIVNAANTSTPAKIVSDYTTLPNELNEQKKTTLPKQSTKSTTESNASLAQTEKAQKQQTYIIAGATVAGVIVLVVVILVAFKIRRKKSSSNRSSIESIPTENKSLPIGNESIPNENDYNSKL